LITSGRILILSGRKGIETKRLAFLRDPLEDLCISRPKTRLEWGITLPFDEIT